MSDPSTISLADIQSRLAEASAAPQEASPTPQPETADSMDTPFTEAAAVLVFYDPATINPISGDFTKEERKKLVSHLMGCSEMLSDSDSDEPPTEDNASAGYDLHFTLPDACRKKMLHLLFEKNLIAAALQANEQDTLSSKYVLQRIFTGCLQGNQPDLMNLNLEELNALYKVSAWLSDIKGAIKLPDKKDILHRIEMVEMLTPMKHLTGVYRDGVFHVMFRGRQKELSTLRSYVGVAAPQGISEKIGRIFEQVWPFGSSEKKPLLIFGQGGIGKSTLLAKFILEHVEAQKKDRFPFVYLDFDRPNLSALEPETLLIEAARLLSIQYRDITDLSNEFLDYYWKWNDQYISLIDASQTQSINLKSLETSKKKELDRAAMQQDFLTLIRKLSSHESRPFLLILDTFEEVQYKGLEYVRSLYDFVQRLRTEYPLLRAIIAGRAPVPQIDTYKLELKELDRDAAEGYLTKVGISNPADAKVIAAQIGGNPLTLKLAAELVQKYGAAELLAVKTDVKQQQSGSKRLPEMQLQGILYKRILKHLHNAEVRKLAHPGMVLRRITPELILKVLAGPCELTIQNMEEAQALFEKIAREVSLVTMTEPGVLRHRTDIRKVMLKLIEQEKREVVMQIHQGAAEYYNGKESMADRAERLYHLLALDFTRADLESLWDEGMQNYLMGSLDELPPRGQAFLLAKTGRETGDSSVWESADMEDRNRRTAKQAARLLNSGRAADALQVLEQVVPDTGQEIIAFLTVRALTQLDRMEEAHDIANTILNSFYRDQLPPAVLAELEQFVAGYKPNAERNQQESSGSESGSSPKDDYDTFDSDITFKA